jgi:hypothetical protein
MTIKLKLLDEDIQRLWTEEALRRDAELDAGIALGRDAEDVFRDARARLLRRSTFGSNPGGDNKGKS